MSGSFPISALFMIPLLAFTWIFDVPTYTGMDVYEGVMTIAPIISFVLTLCSLLLIYAARL